MALGWRRPVLEIPQGPAAGGALRACAVAKGRGASCGHARPLLLRLPCVGVSGGRLFLVMSRNWIGNKSTNQFIKVEGRPHKNPTCRGSAISLVFLFRKTWTARRAKADWLQLNQEPPILMITVRHFPLSLHPCQQHKVRAAQVLSVASSTFGTRPGTSEHSFFKWQHLTTRHRLWALW